MHCKYRKRLFSIWPKNFPAGYPTFLFLTWIDAPKSMLMLFAMISTLATTNACCNFLIFYQTLFGLKAPFYHLPSFLSYRSPSASRFAFLPFPASWIKFICFLNPGNILISDNILFLWVIAQSFTLISIIPLSSIT